MSDATAREPERMVVEYSFFGKDAVFHHVGVAVKSILAVSPSSTPVVEQTEGVSLAFVEVNGVTIELLEPLGDDSPIAASVRNGTKLLHLCFEVEDLEGALGRSRSAGFHCIRPPAPTEAMDGRRIAWVFSKHYGLVELLERSGTA